MSLEAMQSIGAKFYVTAKVIKNEQIFNLRLSQDFDTKEQADQKRDQVINTYPDAKIMAVVRL